MRITTTMVFCRVVPLVATALLGGSSGAHAAQRNRRHVKPDYSAILEPSTRMFLQEVAAKGGPPIYTLSPEKARAVLNGVQSSPVSKMPAQIDDLAFPAGPRGDISVRIVRPEAVTQPLPAVVYIHGGGWILGNKETHDRLIRELANGIQAAVVFVNYSLSPEARYPVAIEEIYAAAKYVVENGSLFGIDGSRLAVAGDSVGGGMTIAVSLLAKERGGPKIAFQGILYPVTNAAFDDASYKQFGDGAFWLSRKAMKWFFNAYEPDHMKWSDIHISPLRASLDELSGLPPALVITDESDVLRDEGEAFAHKLSQAGVRVTTTRYIGTVHDFMMLNPFTDDPAPRAAIAQTISALRAALSGDTRSAERKK